MSQLEIVKIIDNISPGSLLGRAPMIIRRECFVEPNSQTKLNVELLLPRGSTVNQTLHHKKWRHKLLILRPSLAKQRGVLRLILLLHDSHKERRGKGKLLEGPSEKLQIWYGSQEVQHLGF